jgi:ubiquinone/menaquinone biosynthesis C-methylase UbiE
MLKEAVRSTKIDTSPSFARADAKNLPFEDASFVGAVCGGSLNEFGEPARVLRETRRVLLPGGRLAIMGLLEAGSTWGRRLQRFLSIGGVRFFEPAEVTSLLDHAGFDPDPLRARGVVFFAGATRRP